MDEDDVAEPPLFTGFQARSSDFEPLIIHQSLREIGGFYFAQIIERLKLTIHCIYFIITS